MKTIAFYSYKGGMGKTLGIANFATCLSRLGIHSAIVDLDFESPSLHSKFSDAGYSPGMGGFLKYFMSHITVDEISGGRFNLDFTDPDDIKNYVRTLPMGHKYGTRNKNGLKGKIHLIPSGDPTDSEYWDKALGHNCRRLFRFHKEHEEGFISKKDHKRCIKHFLDIKKYISNLKPNPEYLLVDIGAGSHEIAMSINSIWADVIVCMFSFNEDNLNYIGTILDKLDTQTLGGSKSVVIPTLCRIPTRAEYRGDRALNKLLKVMGHNELFVLHSDQDLEWNEEIRLGYDNQPMNTRLTHDYIKLFEKLMQEKHIPSDGIRKAIGLDADLQEQDRVFNLEVESGALINPNDESRNVSFKVETFQLLIRGLEEGVEQSSGTQVSNFDDKTEKNAFFNKILQSAGNKCGAKFSNALNDMWKEESEPGKRFLGEEAYIRKWCDFDSDIGFGKFELFNETVTTQGGKFRKGHIVLRESFLTPAIDIDSDLVNDHAYCSFITGYISGVLSKMLDDIVTVKHLSVEEVKEVEVEEKRTFFYWDNPKSDSCVFLVERGRKK